MKLHTLPSLPPQVINPNQRLCPSIRAVQYPRRTNRQPLTRELDPVHVVDAQELFPRLRVAAEVPGRMCHRRRLRRLSRLGFGRCSRVLTPSILEVGGSVSLETLLAYGMGVCAETAIDGADQACSFGRLRFGVRFSSIMFSVSQSIRQVDGDLANLPFSHKFSPGNIAPGLEGPGVGVLMTRSKTIGNSSDYRVTV